MKSILEVVRDLIKPYIDKNADNIASVEVSPAESGHSVGSQIIYNGVLYNVTSTISENDDLVVGTNIALAPNVSTQIMYAQNAVKNNIKENGTKNIIPFPYNGFTTGTFATLTVNDDCSITFSCSTGDSPTYYITKCSGNGAKLDACEELCTILKGNTYVLTGRKGYANCIVDYYDSSLQYISSQQSPVNGAETLIVPSNAIYTQLYVNVNTSYSFDDTVYPMICLKSDYDFSSAYTPCAKTNLQLSRATNNMTGATASTAGAHGLVPAPAAGDNTKFLGGDGTWKNVPAELSGLTDVTLTSPSDGQLLRYDATTQKWKNAELSYIGMIIHSTTLDTEAKVKAVYGGTTWVKIEGKFLLGTSSSHAIGSTGGEETHTLTVAEMPSHSHSVNNGATTFATGGNNDVSQVTGGARNYTYLGIGYSGGDQPHNNMPPYKTVYIWERTQ